MTFQVLHRKYQQRQGSEPKPVPAAALCCSSPGTEFGGTLTRLAHGKLLSE